MGKDARPPLWIPAFAGMTCGRTGMTGEWFGSAVYTEVDV